MTTRERRLRGSPRRAGTEPPHQHGTGKHHPGLCADLENGTVEVTIDYPVQLITGWFGVSLPLEGKGVMICGG